MGHPTCRFGQILEDIKKRGKSWQLNEMEMFQEDRRDERLQITDLYKTEKMIKDDILYAEIVQVIPF